MCGIVGYVGPRNAADFLLSGLRRLEYRGYDSAGIATLTACGEMTVTKAVGRIDALADALGKCPAVGGTGIGHTRWATHGPATQRKRPSAPRRRRRAGRGPQRRDRELPAAQGAARRSRAIGSTRPPTPRSIAHLIDQLPAKLQRPSRRTAGRSTRPAGRCRQAALAQLQGHLRPGDPVPRMARGADRRPAGQPAGRGRRQRRAFHGQRRLAPGRLHRQDRLPGRPRTGRRHGRPSAGDPPRPGAHPTTAFTLLRRSRPATSTSGGFPHYMLKEIFEQPESMANAMRGRLDPDAATAEVRRPEPVAAATAPRRPDRADRLRHQLARGAGGRVSDRRRWPGCRSRWNTPASCATAIRRWTTTRWCSPSPKAARRPTRWRRCAR